MLKVAVLMSTYNGEKFLREQIDSVLNQKGVNVTLFIRDDGSTDNTINIIKEYMSSHSNIKLSNGNNIGVGNSFMRLVYEAPSDYDYYAFADQDDVWLPEKLINALNMLEEGRGPKLYCSNQILVDARLNKIGMRYETNPDISYKQIMCQNKIAGCTMVWNKDLQALLSDETRRPSEELLARRIHDVWVAMVASIIGVIRYQNDGYILYRQHETNVVGVRKANIIKQWFEKLKDPTQRNGRSMLCREVYINYKDLIVSDSIKKQLDVYGNYINNKAYKKELFLKNNELISHTGESLLGFKVKILLNLV